MDVSELALESATIFGWSDPITEIKAADIKGFEGALFPDEERTRWLLLYNNMLSSAGRIRFTQAHELGHYIIHRHHGMPFNAARPQNCGTGPLMTKILNPKQMNLHHIC